MSGEADLYWIADGWYVKVTDHDRIVAGLQTQVGQLMAFKKAFEEGYAYEGIKAERDKWQREAVRLAMAMCTLGKIEFDHLTEDSKLAEALLLIQEAIRERDRLAERCRELEADYKILLQYEDAAIRDEAKYLTEIDTLRAEAERLRNDAERFRRLRNLPDEMLGVHGVPCVAVPDGPRAGRYVSGTDLDAALEASR